MSQQQKLLQNEIESRLTELVQTGHDVRLYLLNLLGDARFEKKKHAKQISHLADFQDENLRHYGMCYKGHNIGNPRLQSRSNSDMPCIQCKKPFEDKGGYANNKSAVCVSCMNENNLPHNSPNVYKYQYCSKCPHENVKRTKTELKNQENKKKVIADCLRENPSLSLDLLTNLPRAAALRALLDEISINEKGPCYTLYLIDLDNFKSLNSALGHDGADKVIIKIAEILIQHRDAVNAGKWDDYDKYGALNRAWLFRQGGDEMSLIVKGNFNDYTNQKSFYYSWKKAINSIKVKDFVDFGKDQKEQEMDISAARKAMKDRKTKQWKQVSKGLGLSNHVEKVVDAAIKNEKINEKTFGSVGISVGMFCGYTHNKKCTTDDWLAGAEKACDFVKENGKDNIAIVYAGDLCDPTKSTYWKW